MKPPVAKREAHVTTLHGDTRTDFYHWLRSGTPREDADIMAYLEAENTYAENMMATHQSLQDTLYQELVAALPEENLSEPFVENGWLYYTKTLADQQYTLHCRRRENGAEEILLDLNQVARNLDAAYLELGCFKVSPDGNTLAYSLDTTGSRSFTVYFKNLQTGKTLPQHLQDVWYDLEWLADSTTVVYVGLDDAHRSLLLYRYTLGESPQLIFEEKDEALELSLKTSRSGEYLFVTSGDLLESRVNVLPRDTGALRLFAPLVKNVFYTLEHIGKFFVVLTTQNAPDGKVMVAPVTNSSTQNARCHDWQELLSVREGIVVEDVRVFARHLVIKERVQGVPRLQFRSHETGELRCVHFAEPFFALELDEHSDFHGFTLRVRYSSLITPERTIDINLETLEQTVIKETRVQGYDPSRFKLRYIWATAPDGMSVPVVLAHKEGADFPQPLYLHGYGGYGAVSPIPKFNPNFVPLLKRGVTIAMAYPRGGGLLGRRWYDEARCFSKKTTFTDFIACAEHLMKTGYTVSQQLAIKGISAGGLLVGAVLNERPDLFKAAVATVPFVDVLNTMLDTSLWSVISEFEEYGNPQELDAYPYIKSFAPYENVRAQDYPALFVSAGLNDANVNYWEPAKWVAKLREHKTDTNPLIFKTHLNAGHGGASGRFTVLREVALEYAFVLSHLGVIS
jgi:oligopeptidase B